MFLTYSAPRDLDDENDSDTEEEDLGALGMSVKDVDASGNVVSSDEDDDEDLEDGEDDKDENGGDEKVDEPVDGLEALDRLEREVQEDRAGMGMGDDEV
jgi:hypothetical protein